ncbi:MAG: hypothetical protein JHC31_03995 [Sulfurihydrogenibium sp.]|nr:hypothetical protein [Sulfurihydrogenibium sp.]
MKNLEIKTVEIKKKEKTEYWKAIEVGGKTFRISNYLAKTLECNHKPYIEIYCFYVPEKSLILTKEKRDRILISPASSIIYPHEYKVIAKDNKNMITLLRNDYDYIAIIENKLIPLPKSGRRLEKDIDLKLTEIYITNGKVFNKGYRITLIPTDYEVYPKENIAHIARAEIVDKSYKYDENEHRLVPAKKEIYISYRNKEYLMIKKDNEVVLIYDGLYGDAYKVFKFDEKIEIDDEALFEMAIRSRNYCYFYMNNTISYSNPKRIKLYKHNLIPITLAEGKIVTATVNGEKEEILLPGNRKILFIHGTHHNTPPYKKENVFYTIHSEKIEIHNDDPKLVLGYTGQKTIDITDLENEEITIKKWKYEIVDTKEDEENVFIIDNIDEIKARVIGVIEVRKVKISEFLKEFTPYKVERECKIKEKNIIEGIRTHKRHYISIPTF